MKISGSYVLHGSRQAVWDALRDPDVMVGAVPGCETLWETDDGTLMAHVRVGVGAIDGLLDGPVALYDDDPFNSWSVGVAWRGAAGTIDATATVHLHDDGDSTTVDYDADASIGGPMGAVGQRLLMAAAQRHAAALFVAVDQHLTGAQVLETADETSIEPAPAAQLKPVASAAPRPPAEATRNAAPSQLVLAASAGAAVALAGVALTRRRAR